MSEFLSLLSLRFRCGPGQERGSGACRKMNPSSILLVDGCCKVGCGTAAGVIDAKTAGSKGSVFFMMVEAFFWKLPQPTLMRLG